ncbi:helix-turn-helix domain-containing protein [Acaryochloris marina NIES-2412]|uniref:helix-turn-helix domain-containing protein n=1 Tax=Acaryochloris marina TaxID=155978 RepID=UPI004058B46E
MTLLKERMKVGIEIDVPGLGEKIRAARKESNLGLTQLAANAGLSVSGWYSIEQERVKILPMETLRNIEASLGCTFNVEER